VAITQLLKQTEAAAIVASSRTHVNAQNALSGSSEGVASLVNAVSFDHFLEPSGLPLSRQFDPSKFVSEDDRNVVILHSSGTTGMILWLPVIDYLTQVVQAYQKPFLWLTGIFSVMPHVTYSLMTTMSLFVVSMSQPFHYFMYVEPLNHSGTFFTYLSRALGALALVCLCPSARHVAFRHHRLLLTGLLP
jgi:hypothetical protein